MVVQFDVSLRIIDVSILNYLYNLHLLLVDQIYLLDDLGDFKSLVLQLPLFPSDNIVQSLYFLKQSLKVAFAFLRPTQTRAVFIVDLPQTGDLFLPFVQNGSHLLVLSPQLNDTLILFFQQG